MSERTYQRQLKNYLLDWRYQLRYTLTIVGISALLTGGLGYVVIKKAREASRLLEVRAMDPEDMLAQQLQEAFARNDKITVMVLVGFGLLLSIILTVYGIVLTHKVAGPIFKISTYLHKIRDGQLNQVYPIRRGDQLVEFFEVFKGAHDALRARTQEDIALIDKALGVIQEGPVAEELKRAKAKKEESLG